MNQFKKAYELSKIWFHSLPENIGLELHHVWGRVGIFLCCRIGMVGLTRGEHNSWEILKEIRHEMVGKKLMVMDNYDRMTGKCREIIDVKCEKCAMRDLTN